MPIKSVVRNPNEEASRVMDRGCVRFFKPLTKRDFQCKLKNVLCVPDYSSKILSVSRCADWGHSFEKINICLKLQKGTRVKLTQEKNLIYLPCSFLEFKMSSNSVKFDIAILMAQTIGSIESSGWRQECTRDSGELDDVCNVCALTKTTETPVPRVAEAQAEKKLERVFTDVMGSIRLESLSKFRFCIVFEEQYMKVFVELLKAKSEALASLMKSVLSVGTTTNETRQGDGLFFRAFKYVLFRCRHSTGK